MPASTMHSDTEQLPLLHVAVSLPGRGASAGVRAVIEECPGIVLHAKDARGVLLFFHMLRMRLGVRFDVEYV